MSYQPWAGPNTSGSLTSTGRVSNYTWASGSRTFFSDFSERVDHQFNANLKAYSSYTYNYQSDLQRPTGVAVPAFDYANGIITPFTQQNASAGLTWLLRTTALNDVRLGFYRLRNDSLVPAQISVSVPRIDCSSSLRFMTSSLSGSRSPPGLAALDGFNRVILVGSFSKTLTGAARCGFIVARNDWMEGLTDLALATSFGTNDLTAQATHRLLLGGSYKEPP